MINTANKLLGKFGHGQAIKNIFECDHNFFINIYEQMLNEKLPGLIPDAKEPEEQIHNIQVVIDLLATDVLGVDLSHIDAQSIVQGNELHIQNLLEIFDGLLEFVMEELEKEDDEIEQNKNNEGVRSD